LLYYVNRRDKQKVQVGTETSELHRSFKTKHQQRQEEKLGMRVGWCRGRRAGGREGRVQQQRWSCTA